MFGIPVEKVQTNETSSLGAAIGGFLSIGQFKTVEEAVASMVHVTKRFEPNMENHAVYEDLFENVYSKMYPSLKDIYKYLYRKAQR